MNGTAENSDSGYCDYLPPEGMEAEYDGNAFASGSRAGVWCYPPYGCLLIDGCDTRQPDYDAFIRWGEATVFGPPSEDVGYAFAAKHTARSLQRIGAIAGGGAAGSALAGRLGALAASTQLAKAVFPYATAVTPEVFAMINSSAWKSVARGVSALQAQRVASAAGDAAIGIAKAAGRATVGLSTALVVITAVAAIAIAVTEGIEVSQQDALPGQLAELVEKALASTPDLLSMLGDQSHLKALFGLVLRAAGPPPAPLGCDNSGFMVFGGETFQPCANAPDIPAPSTSDPQFRIQRVSRQDLQTPVGPAEVRDSITYYDTELDHREAYRQVQEAWTHTTRMTDGWFVSDTRYQSGESLPQRQSVKLSYLVYDPGAGGTPYTATAWAHKKTDGSYEFVDVINGYEIDPNTCVALNGCHRTDSLLLWLPDPDGYAYRVPALVTLVPRREPVLSITPSSQPLVGEPVTLSVANTGLDLGALSYEWYIRQASGLSTVCPASQPHCAYEGPFTGSQVDFTWQGSGDFKVIVVARDSTGRTYTTEKIITVGSIGPRLGVILETAPARAGSTFTLAGTVVRSGSADVTSLSVDWGDGSSVEDTYSSASLPGCGQFCNPRFTPASATRLDWAADHTWETVGSFEVVVTTTDDHDHVDRKYLTVTVGRGEQTLESDQPADQTFDAGSMPLEVTGGRSTKPVLLDSASPGVCTVGAPVQNRVDDRVRATAKVQFIGLGECVVTATQDGDVNYSAATSLTRSFAITRGKQGIFFPEFTGEPVLTSTAPFEVSVAGGLSQETVDVASTTPGVCTTSSPIQSRSDLSGRAIATTTVTVIGPGECSIRATQGGDALYSAAEPVTRSFEVVERYAQVLAFAGVADRAYGDAPFTVTVTGGASTAPISLTSTTESVCRLSGITTGRENGRAVVTATVTISFPGDCVLSANQGAAGDYTAAEPKTSTITIAKTPQVIDFSPIDDRFVTSPNFAITASSSSSVWPVVFSGTPDVCDVRLAAFQNLSNGGLISTGEVDLVGPGTCDVSATQAGSAVTAAATPVTRSFRVMTSPNQVTPRLTASTLTEAVVGAPGTFAGEIAKGQGLDTVKLTVQWGDGTSGTLTHDPQLSTTCVTCGISFAPLSATKIDWTASHTWAHAGAYDVVVVVEDQRGYKVRKTLTIDVRKASQSVSFKPVADKGLDDLTLDVEARGGPAGTEVSVVSTTPDVCTVEAQTPSRVSGEAHTSALVRLVGAGTCGLSATQDGDADWFAADEVSMSFAVAKGTQEIFFPHIQGPIRLGTAPIELPVTGGSALQPVQLNSDTPEVCTASEALQTRISELIVHQVGTTTITLVGPGECTITATQGGDSDYLPAKSVSRSFTVVPKLAQTLAFAGPADQTYGDAPFQISVTGGESSQPVLLTSARPEICAVSNTVTGRQAARATLEATISVVGAGECSLTAAQAGDSNYADAQPLTRTFTVRKAGQFLTFGSLVGRTYGDSAFPITAIGGGSTAPVALTSNTPAVCTIGGVTNDRTSGLARTTATVTVVGAGSCTITAQQAGDASYDPASPSLARTFTVAKAPLTVTADDTSMILGGTVPALTYRYRGFVGSDTAAAVTGIVCSARTSTGQAVGATTPVGSYPITCSGATAANYEIAYRPGALRVLYSYGGLTGYSTTSVNQAKAGSTLSLLWTLKTAAGQLVTNLSSYVSLTAAPMTCGGPLPTTGAQAIGPASELKYDPKKSAFVYNWKTPATLAGTCQALTLNLADGTANTIRFQFAAHDRKPALKVMS